MKKNLQALPKLGNYHSDHIRYCFHWYIISASLDIPIVFVLPNQNPKCHHCHCLTKSTGSNSIKMPMNFQHPPPPKTSLHCHSIIIAPKLYQRHQPITFVSIGPLLSPCHYVALPSHHCHTIVAPPD